MISIDFLKYTVLIAALTLLLAHCTCCFICCVDVATVYITSITAAVPSIISYLVLVFPQDCTE